MNAFLRILAMGAATTAAASVLAVDVYGVDGNNTLVRFDSATPNTTTSLGLIGVGAGERLIGLDFRSNGGALYAVGSTGNIYTLSTATGAILSTTAITGATLDGSAFYGVDFNPAADRLRIVSSNGQSLRINVATGAATVDTSVAYAAGDPNAGNSPFVAAVAYTNNQLGLPNPAAPAPAIRSTQLFDIDTRADILALQNPPNNGTLNTRGSLGLDATLVDLDIFTDAGGVNTAFLALGSLGGQSSFGTIDLTTGAVGATTLLGGGVVLIAAQPVPEPATMAVLGLGAAALLRRRRKA